MPGLLAFVFGWLAFRSRVTGVYLSIITQALSYALMLAFFRNDMGFGGNNGFTDFKDSSASTCSTTRRASRWSCSPPLALAASYCACRFIVASRAGRVIRAIRDAESRTRFLGYRVESYKLWVFVFSAVIAGIAGALYVPQVGIINPSEFQPINSIEVVIWVAVGGRGTLYRRGAGRGARQLREDVLHRRAAGSLALRARRAVRAGHALPAARARRAAPGAARRMSHGARGGTADLDRQ